MKYGKPSLEEETHRYILDNIEYPSVTTVLERLYNFSGIPNYRLELARERGSAVHKACELDDLGELDEEDLDPRLLPYVQAWRSWKFETGFELAYDITNIHNPGSDSPLVEYSLCDPILGIAGTPDVVGVCKKLKGRPRAVVDRKATAAMSRVTGVQLSGYKLLLKSNEYPVDLRYGVLLKPDGKAINFPFTDFGDDSVFMSELISYNWCKKNNIKGQQNDN